METLARIEDACKANDQESIKQILSSLPSDELKEQAFLKITTHYEEKGLFPVGYSLMLIKLLIQKHDFKSAMKHILKCIQKGVSQEKISKLICEYLIKPEESIFRERFNRNLRLLKSSETLFTGMEFVFEQAQKNMTIIANYQEGFPQSLLDMNDGRALMVDVINIKVVRSILEKNNTVYLVFDDLKKFYYTLVFEDLSEVEKYVREKKILIFADNDKSLPEKFFSNVLVLPPDYYYDLSVNEGYRKKVNAVVRTNLNKASKHLNNLKEYYGSLNSQYYRELLAVPPSGIKVMFITSEGTELNKFIAKNWYRAFLELGYQARLLIENEPYETMNRSFIYREMDEYKPDIVFHVNHSINSVFGEEEIRRNLLWIMRYRDITKIHSPESGNMFVISMVKEWVEDLESNGFPDGKILYTPDGVDLNIFAKKEILNKRYACDIVSVNNSGGDEFYRFTYSIEQFKDINIRQAIHELYAEINEMAAQEQFIFYDRSFEKLLYDRLIQKGIMVNEEVKNFIIRFFTLMMFAFYRRKVVEWIIDSGITKNIKVWGRGWSNYEKFKKYHMGIAMHGEELAGIYSNGKISISDHPNVPLHERTFEILGSGGFPLVKHMQPENGESIDYVTNYFKENEEIVLFYGKDDLLNKIQYYLDNPDERERIAENGRNVVIRDFSSVAVAKKTMKFIKEYYRE